MDNYIVSARKYRPTKFSSVVGQESLTQTLLNSIKSKKLAHAYLFCGPRGVGKTTCARIFARTINCTNPDANGEACMECESCKSLTEGRSYSIHELDAASNNSVEDIRSLIEQAQIPPQTGKYKVFIIDEVHMLSPAAFNAFLKTLEEPPSYAIFILATTEKHKILPTILSRCQTYDFNRMSVSDITSHLEFVAKQENISYEPDALNIIAQKADGGMRDALSIFDQTSAFCGGNITYQETIKNLNVLDYEYYFRLTDMFLEQRISDIMLTFNEVLNSGFEGKQFIGGLASHLRNLLVSKDAATTSLLDTSENIRKQYAEQATKCNVRYLFRALKVCNECDLKYRESQNKRLLVEITLIQLAQMTDEGDESSSGHQPRNVLKPIFTLQVTKKVEAGDNAQKENKNINPNAGKSIPIEKTAEKKAESPVTTQRTRVTSAQLRSTSIHRITNGQERQLHQTAVTGIAVAEPKKTTEPLQEEELSHAWLCYANLLPKEKNMLSNRMKNAVTRVTGDNTFSITVDNVLAKDFFVKEFNENIKAYLASRLKNEMIKIDVIIDENQDPVKTMLPPREILANECEKNPNLKTLVEVMKLQLTS